MPPLLIVAANLSIAAASAWCAAAAEPWALEVEAEAAQVVKPPLTLREARGASGGKVLYADVDLWNRADRFVAIEPKSGLVGGVGLAEYRVDVPAAGEYATWFRCWYLNSGDDSFYFRADDGQWSIISELKQFEWRRIRGPVLKLAAGSHRVQIAGREDNSILDKFLRAPHLGLGQGGCTRGLQPEAHRAPHPRHDPPGPPQLGPPDGATARGLATQLLGAGAGVREGHHHTECQGVLGRRSGVEGSRDAVRELRDLPAGPTHTQGAPPARRG